MKIKSITIKDESTAVKWESGNGAKWSVESDRLIDGDFGAAMAELNKVAAQTLHHPAEEMSVRSVKITERKKDGMEFVVIAGVLAAHSKDGQSAKAGKFSTGKIRVDLLAQTEVNRVTEAAIEWAKQVGVK